jgi:hypothetical protein
LKSAPQQRLTDKGRLLLGRFAARIGIPPASTPKQAIALADAYFRAHPVRAELSSAMDGALRDLGAAKRRA